MIYGFYGGPIEYGGIEVEEVEGGGARQTRYAIPIVQAEAQTEIFIPDLVLGPCIVHIQLWLLGIRTQISSREGILVVESEVGEDEKAIVQLGVEQQAGAPQTKVDTGAQRFAVLQ